MILEAESSSWRHFAPSKCFVIHSVIINWFKIELVVGGKIWFIFGGFKNHSLVNRFMYRCGFNYFFTNKLFVLGEKTYSALDVAEWCPWSWHLAPSRTGIWLIASMRNVRVIYWLMRAAGGKWRKHTLARPRTILHGSATSQDRSRRRRLNVMSACFVPTDNGMFWSLCF